MGPAHVGRVLFRGNVIGSEVFAAKRYCLANGLIIGRKLVEKSNNARVAPISGEERGMTDVEATIDDAQQHAFTIIGLRKRRLSLVQRCAVHPLASDVVHNHPTQLGLYAIDEFALGENGQRIDRYIDDEDITHPGHHLALLSGEQILATGMAQADKCANLLIEAFRMEQSTCLPRHDSLDIHRQ